MAGTGTIRDAHGIDWVGNQHQRLAHAAHPTHAADRTA